MEYLFFLFHIFICNCNTDFTKKSIAISSIGIQFIFEEYFYTFIPKWNMRGDEPMNNENRFKKLRLETKTKKNKPLGQDQLAEEFEKLGFPISQSVISKTETSKKYPPTSSITTIQAYCEYFNTTSDYLLGIRDIQQKDENLAMVSKVTKLSGKSIERLINANTEQTIIIDTFIKSDYFHILAELITTDFEIKGNKLFCGDKEVKDEIKKDFRDATLIKNILLIYDTFTEEKDIYNYFTKKALTVTIEELNNKIEEVHNGNNAVINTLLKVNNETIEEISDGSD